MRDQVGLLDLLRSAHIGQVEMDTRSVGAHGLRVPRRGKRIHIGSCQHLRAQRGVNVDGGNAGLHSHCFADRPYRHFGVNRDRHIGRHGDFLLHRTEAGQSEGDRVKARPDVNNRVASIFVGGLGARSFDQRLAGGFHLHARHHRA